MADSKHFEFQSEEDREFQYGHSLCSSPIWRRREEGASARGIHHAVGSSPSPSPAAATRSSAVSASWPAAGPLENVKSIIHWWWATMGHIPAYASFANVGMSSVRNVLMSMNVQITSGADIVMLRVVAGADKEHHGRMYFHEVRNVKVQYLSESRSIK